MCWEILTCIVLNPESSCVQVTLGFLFFFILESVGRIRHVMKLFFAYLLDELIKPLLSSHKRLLSEWTYRTKASDAKR